MGTIKKVPLVYGQYKATPPTLIDGAVNPLMEDVNGNLKVVGSGPGGELDAIVTGTQIVKDTNNSTTTPLTAGATFTGTATDVLGYAQIHLTFAFRPNQVPSGDGSTAKASLSFQFSPDGTNWDIQVPVFIRSGINIPQTLIVVDRYFRVVYLNDGGASAISNLGITDESAGTPTTQTQFRLNTYLVPVGTKELGRTIDQSVSGSDPVTLGRNVLLGKAPDLSYRNVNVNQRTDGTFALHVEGDTGDRTIFGSQFVEGIYDNIQINFATDIPSALVSSSTVGTGTNTQSAAQALLQTGTGSTGSATLVSRSKLIYRPGHESRVNFTAAFTTGVASSTQYAGLFDTSNGFFIGYNGTTFVVVRRSGGSDTVITRADWNGNLATAFTRSGVAEAIDFTKGNVYRIRFGWLGNSVINFEVLSPDGNWALMHQIKFPNSSSVASIQNPDLPMRMQATNAGNTTNITLRSSSWSGGSLGLPTNGLPARSNFSTTALGAGGTYTGAYEPVNGFVSIAVVIKTDQVSGTDGISIDFSDDGSTIRRTTTRTFDATDVTTGSKFFAFPVTLPYFRIRYTNGGTPQGSFFLQCTLNAEILQPGTDGLEATLSASSSATMVRNVITAKNASSTYGNIERGTSGGLDIGIVQHEVATPIKALTSFKSTQVSVLTTATQVATTPLTNRKSVSLKSLTSNGSSRSIFIGTTSAVSSSTGYELASGDSIDMEIDDTVAIWAISNSGTNTLCVCEIAGTSTS